MREGCANSADRQAPHPDRHECCHPQSFRVARWARPASEAFPSYGWHCGVLAASPVGAGLPPAIPTWQEERDRKNKFVHWLRSNGFMVVTKDGAPAEEGHYKANVDVMMAIDALELSMEMRPDVVILVTGDADFAYLATKLRRHGIRVEVASVSANLGNILRSAANDVIDLAPLFRTFEMKTVQDAAPQAPNRTPRPQQPRRRPPRFRPIATSRQSGEG